MSTSDEEKQRLELLVTEHELLLEQFSELIQNQQAQIDRLSQKLESLQQKLEKDDGPATDLADEPPPHY